MSHFEKAISHSRMQANCQVSKHTEAAGGERGSMTNPGGVVSTSEVIGGPTVVAVKDSRHFATGPAHEAPQLNGNTGFAKS